MTKVRTVIAVVAVSLIGYVLLTSGRYDTGRATAVLAASQKETSQAKTTALNAEQRAKSLEEEVEDLKSRLAQAEQAAADAEQAKTDAEDKARKAQKQCHKDKPSKEKADKSENSKAGSEKCVGHKSTYKRGDDTPVTVRQNPLFAGRPQGGSYGNCECTPGTGPALGTFPRPNAEEFGLRDGVDPGVLFPQ